MRSEAKRLPRLEDVEELASLMLERTDEPVVRYRLLRDVLRSPQTSVLRQERDKVLQSRHILELVSTQRKDGNWGRFHSRDGTDKRTAYTTETAVERGLALGLDAECTVFRRAISYMISVLEGIVVWPDPPEKNDRWPVGVQLITAATLAQVDPGNRSVDKVWEVWFEIARRAFASGSYDAHAEILAHRELTGASVKDSYLTIHNRYSLSLLAARSRQIPMELQRAIVKWIWRREKGVGYLHVALHDLPECSSSSRMERWMRSLEILSGFECWTQFSGEAVEWLWKSREKNDLWDFGSKGRCSTYYPLSESWRKKENRQIDCSTRALSLLRRFYPNSFPRTAFFMS